MSRLLQAGLACAVALGAHVAAFAAMPRDNGPAGLNAAGEGGEALISLAPAPQEVADLIAAWETPPEPTPEPVAPKAPETEVAPAMPEPVALPQPTAPGVVALPEAEPLPKADQAPEAPAPKLIASKPVDSKTPEKKPKPAPEKTAPAAPAQKAKGRGKGAAAGDTGKDQSATLSNGQIKQLQAEWGSRIRAKLERAKRYPAKANGAAGKVVLSLVVAADGRLRAVKVKQSSGNAALDGAALATVKAAGRFPKAPKGVPESSVKVTLRFDPP